MIIFLDDCKIFPVHVPMLMLVIILAAVAMVDTKKKLTSKQQQKTTTTELNINSVLNLKYKIPEILLLLFESL